MSDFTVVVQGRLHPRLREALPAYQKVGPVIVSYWEGDDESILDGLDVVRVKNADVNVAGVFNNQNVYRQTRTTLAGLERVGTKYAIKARTDESFTDLAPVVAAIESRPEAFTCLNIFIRSFDMFGVHPSDHLFGSRTDLLIKSFELLRAHLEKWSHTTLVEIDNVMFNGAYISVMDIKDNTFLAVDANHERYAPPEPMIGDHWLLAKGLVPKEATKDTVREHFQLVDESLTGYVNKHGDVGPYDSRMPEIRTFDEL